MASQRPAPEIFGDDPHLVSRATSGLVFTLEPPEDHIRLLVLDKMAADRQIRISPDVCTYLVRRKSRNLKEMERLIELLDQVSLELKRRITLPLVKTLESDGVI